MIRAATAEDANVIAQVGSCRELAQHLPQSEAVIRQPLVEQREDFWQGAIGRVKKQVVLVATEERRRICE